MNFLNQAPAVENLLRACMTAAASLQKSERDQLQAAMKVFESSAAPMVISASELGVALRSVHLADAEKLEAINQFVDRYCVSDSDWSNMQRIAASVAEHRPAVGKLQLVGQVGGSAWVAVQMQGDGTCKVIACQGAGGISEEIQAGYPEARDRADFVAAEINRSHAERLKSTGEICLVVIPKASSQACAHIDPSSGVVARRSGDRMSVYFEGNRFGAVNLKTYVERVKNAAGRMFQGYPTVARAGYDLLDFEENFEVVGYCTDDYRVRIDKVGALLDYAAQEGLHVPAGDGIVYTRQGSGAWLASDGVTVRQSIVDVISDRAQELIQAI